MHHLLTYHDTDDYLEIRGQFLSDHLCHVCAVQQRCELIWWGSGRCAYLRGDFVPVR